MAAVSLRQLKISATSFERGPKAEKRFFKILEGFASELGIQALRIQRYYLRMARAASQGNVMTYEKFITNFPFTYDYLKNHSSEFLRELQTIRSAIDKTKKIADLQKPLQDFMNISSQNIRSIKFALTHAPILDLVHAEALIIQKKVEDLTDPSVFIVFPLIITLRLLTEPTPFTKETTPRIFRTSQLLKKAIAALAKEMEFESIQTEEELLSYESQLPQELQNQENFSEVIILRYLNQLREKYVGLQQQNAELFSQLEDRIYSNLSSEEEEFEEGTDVYYHPLIEISSCISRGQNSHIFNFCVQLAIEDYA